MIHRLYVDESGDHTYHSFVDLLVKKGGTSEMAKWLLVVESSCADGAREAEFNEWYDKIHIPDVFETSGFIRTNRYENTELGEGKGKFLATYEIETDDIDAVMKTHQDNMAKKSTEGRFSELLVLTSRVLYRQLSSISK
ncbi:DUF4286 family protein [Chloroflexota bacterium]